MKSPVVQMLIVAMIGSPIIWFAMNQVWPMSAEIQSVVFWPWLSSSLVVGLLIGVVVERLERRNPPERKP